MTSLDDRDGNEASSSRFDGDGRGGSLETMLFESLVHQLIEKGLLTKNDALGIVQTVAQVKRSQVTAARAGEPETDVELALLRRLYESFQALRERSAAAGADRANVLQLRPPLHGDAPKFPHEN